MPRGEVETIRIVIYKLSPRLAMMHRGQGSAVSGVTVPLSNVVPSGINSVICIVSTQMPLNSVQ